MMLLIVGLLVLSPPHSEASAPRRVSAQIKDLGKVHPIRMIQGMATLIEIPGPVTGVRCGNPDAVLVTKPERPDNEVTLVLRHKLAQATNLIIRSGRRKFVFDIVPSTDIHQDTVEVVGAYGGPEIEDSEAELVDSSETRGNK